jgi:hypothetical protein
VNVRIAAQICLRWYDAQLLRNDIGLQISVNYPEPCVGIRTGRVIIAVGFSFHAELMFIRPNRRVTQLRRRVNCGAFCREIKQFSGREAA